MPKDSPTRSTRFSGDLDDKFQTYRDENDLSNSEALRRLVQTGMEAERESVWKTVQQQALYAVTFALTLASVSFVSFFAAAVLAGYPSPWTVVSLAFLFGGVLVAAGGGVGYEISKRKAAVAEVDQ
jgi:hypothetical protein